MKASVIIVNYNTRELTLRAVDSVYKYPPNGDFEVIVVDNGSSDGLLEDLKKRQYKDLTLIRNRENIGFARANNKGLKRAQGKYIFLLNSDAEVTKGAINELIDFAQKTPDAGAVVPRLVNPDTSIQPSVYNLPTVKRAIEQYWLRKSRVLDIYYPETTNLVKVEGAVMAAFLITPRGRSAVPHLNSRYFMYFEDLDYCRELAVHGLLIYYYPVATVTHRLGQSGKHLAQWDNQWRRAISGSKIYHGQLRHFLINFIIWSSQKSGIVLKYFRRKMIR